MSEDLQAYKYSDGQGGIVGENEELVIKIKLVLACISYKIKWFSNSSYLNMSIKCV